MKEIKTKLSQAITIKKEIEMLQEERDSIRSLAEVSAKRLHQGGKENTNNSKVEIGAIELFKLEKELEEKEKAFVKTYKDISVAISQIDDPTQRTILRLRYLHGAPWKNICERVQYSWSGVHYQHQKALESFERNWINHIKQ